MDKLTSMKVFTTVAKNGSFSAAAGELGMSRAMVSKHINHLENSLGIRLLNRTTRHISLTEVGMSYRDRLNGILSEIEETELSVTQLQSEPRGTLRIMAPPSFGAFHLARAITAYKEHHPRVTIELILSYRTPDLVEEGMDMAIHVGRLDDSNLVAHQLSSSRMVVCGSPAYFEKRGIPETPDQLEHHNCLVLEYRSPLSGWKFILNNSEKIIHVAGNLVSNMADALRIAAIKGCGLIQLPSYMVGLDIQSGRLKPVLEKYEAHGVPIYAIYPHRKHLSAKVRTFLDFMQAHFHSPPYWDEWMYQR